MATPFTTPKANSILKRQTSYSCQSTVNQQTAITQVVTAITEGNTLNGYEIGIASIDLKHPELVLLQYTDRQKYIKTITELQILDPMQILIPKEINEKNLKKSKLQAVLRQRFPNIEILSFPQKYYNWKEGYRLLMNVCLPEYQAANAEEILSKNFCLSAVSALLKYIEFKQDFSYAPSSLKTEYSRGYAVTTIDANSVRNLELIYNVTSRSSKDCLFRVLDHTRTKVGDLWSHIISPVIYSLLARLLRSSILQPCSDKKTLEERLDSVEELAMKQEIYGPLRSAIDKFCDISNMLRACVQIPKIESFKNAEARIADIIRLRNSLEAVKSLIVRLHGVKSALLQSIYQSLDDCHFQTMIDEINKVIDENATLEKGTLNFRAQICFAVRPEINGHLNVIRKVYEESIDDLASLKNFLHEKYNIPVEIVYNKGRGFHLQLESDLSPGEISSEFIKITRKKKTYFFSTLKLIYIPYLFFLIERLNETLKDIYILSNISVAQLYTNLKSYVSSLYNLSENIAMLDFLLCLGYSAAINGRNVRPTFSDTTAIKDGRHPILDVISVVPPVANDIYMSHENNFAIITGPNMSGKTVYLKQMALLQVMAQIGAYVPATCATFRIVDQIFTKIAVDGSMEENCSSFTAEMKEVNYIMQNATNHSLIIIDELGKGTASEDGIGICFAICEYFLQLKAFTVTSTHFLEICQLEDLYPNVDKYVYCTTNETTWMPSSYHLEVQHIKDNLNAYKLQYTHILAPDRTVEKYYGINLAELSSLPPKVVNRAREICKVLADKKEKCDKIDRKSYEEKATFRLGALLIQTAHNSKLDEASLKVYLQYLKDDYSNSIKTLLSHSNPLK
ncbi:MutS protein-like protein 4 [Trichoplax sp. H2]|nr:MutS protein-like protein 4 [Trichoplax sp. H2]|eukprot:RDD41782.1 MutS protein-like protein 4 [Trichoplax sp. H2]